MSEVIWNVWTGLGWCSMTEDGMKFVGFRVLQAHPTDHTRKFRSISISTRCDVTRFQKLHISRFVAIVVKWDGSQCLFSMLPWNSRSSLSSPHWQIVCLDENGERRLLPTIPNIMFQPHVSLLMLPGSRFVQRPTLTLESSNQFWAGAPAPPIYVERGSHPQVKGGGGCPPAGRQF